MSNLDTSKIKVKHELLEKNTFFNIKNILYSNTFDWYLCECIYSSPEYANSFISVCDDIDNYIFSKTLYDNDSVTGNIYHYEQIILPFYSLLNIKSLIRARVTFCPRNEKIVKHGLHIDHINKDDSTTAVFYVNNNDGYTEFEDGSKFNSIENSIITFPTYYQHTGTTCTNKSGRITINLNYY
tara:strand:- start:57 stop:605 length:549 start_codon:yes stop_codon:yes gene_type:complete